MRYEGKAILEYSIRSRVVAWIDDQIARYYFSLIPKAKYPMRQMYPPHITVVRSHPIEIVENREPWGKYEGREITFRYDGLVQFRFPYFYLDAWSEEIGEIRKELGLEPYRPGFDRYHITIANIKYTEEVA